MKKNNKKLKTFTTLLIFSLTATIFLTMIPTISGHDPAWQIPTFAYINVAPDNIGVQQTAIIVVWLDKVIDAAHISNDIRFHDYELTITKPDGSTETREWPIVSDTTSSAFTQYTPDQVGTYTLDFNFPGQVYDFGGASEGDYYLPSSASTTLNVQEEAIPGVPVYPLPTEYWTRPIESENTAWASIASNYLDPFAAAYVFGPKRLQPDGTAPDSPHILWTKPIQFGGVVGGSNTGVYGATFYTGLSYQPRFMSPIIIYGRLYYGLPKSDSPGGAGFFGGPGGGYVCVDLKTGEELWWKNYTVNPSFGQLVWFDSPNQHGVIPNGYLWAVSGSTWTAYDPLTGDWIFDITNVPSGTREYGSDGDILIYQMDVQNKWLALWSLTSVITDGPEGAVDFMRGYRPVGKVFNSTQRDAYLWNVTIPTLPSDAAIRYVLADDLLVGSAGTSGHRFGGIGTAPSVSNATFWAISLESASRGNLEWIETYQAPPNNVTRQIGPVDPVNRVFCLSDKETMQWLGYDLDTGDLLWGPVGDTRDFNYYPTVGSGGAAQVGFTAYGKLYSGGYGGEIFCYDTSNGNLLWKYDNTFSGLETPYGYTPIFPGAIADGKIYVYSNEHSPNSPQYKDYRARCLNATTGEEIWTLLSWAGVGGFADEGWPVADGIIAYLNTYDMQVYSIGKGPSKLTVDASPKVSEFGKSVLVEGTVIDISAGTKQNEQAARFPDGVPAVSDESMGEWMEYVYMQKPRPSNTVGVEVRIQVVDPAGSYAWIGTTTSDSFGNFAYSFIPQIEGTYSIIASFIGSDSYYGSQQTTYVKVDPATQITIPPYPGYQGPSASDVAQNVVNSLPDNPTTSQIAQAVVNAMPEYPEQQEITVPDYTNMFIIIAILVAIAIVIGLVLLFRKK